MPTYQFLISVLCHMNKMFGITSNREAIYSIYIPKFSLILTRIIYMYIYKANIMELAYLQDVHLSFYLAVNKLITNEAPNIFL